MRFHCGRSVTKGHNLTGSSWVFSSKESPPEILKELFKKRTLMPLCVTEADDFPDGLVTYKTTIIIDMIQSQDFYTLKMNSIPISLGGMEATVEKLSSLIQLNKGYKSLPYCPIGILLHGPSGCGKSSLGKYLAQKCDTTFINVEGSELIHYEYGSGATALKKIFSRAVLLSKEGSVILFLDELDMLCPCDTNANIGSKQITNALVAEMDNLHNQNITGVLVMGATTSLSNVSSSLRRPGRFDQEVLINVPSKEQRTSILEVLSVNMQMESDISLSEIALWTPGYVGADLKALCEEAVHHSLSINPKSTVGKSSFLHALHKVIPSLRRSSNCSVDLQQVSWEEIGGLEDVKAEIKQSVEWPFLYPEVLKSMDLSATKGVLLYGAPGCCKTTLVRAAATSCHVNFLTLNGAQIYSSYVGESERILSETFQKARALSPCILFFDELESLVGKRTSSGKQSRVQERILSTMLNEMDGIGVRLDQKVESTSIGKKDNPQVKKDSLEKSKSNYLQKSDSASTVIVIGATNRPDMIDSAILRPGRMDKLIYVPPPDEQSRRSILKLLLSEMPTKNIDIHELSSKTEHFSGADLKNLCKEAGLMCLRENPDGDTVQQIHFTKALNVIKPSLNDSFLQQYTRFRLK
ncbi:spermatogenesis-associated protein 5-like protein 1 [Bulinus truncatus]|nr:spermatogenesis-associated protein 5-like protein 1 [Bulinus truncatus]